MVLFKTPAAGSFSFFLPAFPSSPEQFLGRFIWLSLSDQALQPHFLREGSTFCLSPWEDKMRCTLSRWLHSSSTEPGLQGSAICVCRGSRGHSASSCCEQDGSMDASPAWSFPLGDIHNVHGMLGCPQWVGFNFIKLLLILIECSSLWSIKRSVILTVDH